jgi:hypothetical protein
MKFKMAATAGVSLTFNHMGKMFQNASSLKPLGQLKPNCPGMIIGMCSTQFMFFYADRKSKMAATAGHILKLDPIRKCSNAFFSETTNMIEAKLSSMYSLALIISVVSEKKAFEHFPIGSNVNICIAVAAILDFRSS